MPRKDTWEAYAEFVGGQVWMIVQGVTRENAELRAKTFIDYDAREMGEPVQELERDDNKTVWITAGTICGAYREWAEDPAPEGQDDPDSLNYRGTDVFEGCYGCGVPDDCTCRG